MSYTITVSWVLNGETDIDITDAELAWAESEGVDIDDTDAVYAWYKETHVIFGWDDLDQDWAYSEVRPGVPMVTGEVIK